MSKRKMNVKEVNELIEGAVDIGPDIKVTPLKEIPEAKAVPVPDLINRVTRVRIFSLVITIIILVILWLMIVGAVDLASGAPLINEE